jgi:hypothetical protein
MSHRVGDYVRALIDDVTGEIVGFRTPADEDQLFVDADDLAASTGSTLVGHIASGTGAVATTVQAVEREVVSITGYAANGVSGVAVDPAGSVSSALGIQAALNAGAGYVYAPTGTFQVQSAVSIPAGVRLVGAGQRATTFRLTASGFDGFTLSGDSSEISDCAISAASARTSGAHVKAAASKRSQKVNRCLVVNAYRGVVVADGCVITSIVGCEFLNTKPTTGVCIEVQGGNDTFITRCVGDGPAGSGNEPAAGIRITKTGAVWLTDIDFIRCGNGLEVVPDNGDECTWIFGVNAAFDSSEVGSGVHIRPTNGGKVKAFQQIGLWCATNINGVNIDTDADAASLVDGVYLESPRLFNNQQYGLLHNGGTKIKNVRLTNPEITGNSSSSIGTYPGLFFGPNAASFYVTGGKSGAQAGFGSSHSYGVVIGAGCSDYTVQGLAVNGNVTGGIANSSASAAQGRMKDNPGSKTRYSGVITIPAGATSLTFAHGMAFIPNMVKVTPYVTFLGGTDYWVDTPTSTNLKVFLSAALGSDALFYVDAEFV